MGEDFDYAEEYTLDVQTPEQDILDVMTGPQAWWPANYCHYSRSSSG